MVDLHSHILPGVDDGSPSWEDSLEMCRLSVADGVTTMAATPHMLDGVYNVPAATALALLAELRTRLAAAQIPLTVVQGADVRVNSDLPALVKARDVLTVGESGAYLLVEFPHDILPPNTAELLFALKLAGICPIITHPERHFAVQQHPELVRPWIEAECLVHITAASITGAFGRAALKCSRQLLDAGWVHMVASDAHGVRRRPPGLSAARALVTEWMGPLEAAAIFDYRPRTVLAGGYVGLPGRPAPEAKGWRWWRRK